MSGTICTCDSQVKHLGLPNCDKNIAIPRRLIFVPTYKNDGTLNYIDAETDAIGTSAYWDNLQYNTDETARYFPLSKDFESVEMAKADSVYEEFPSGRREFVRDGVRSFTGVLPNTAIPIIGKLKSKGCAKLSVFIIDNEGKLIGYEKTKGKLYPLQLADNTMNSIYQFATDTTVPKVMVSFEFDRAIADENISYILAEDIGIDLFTQFKGKMDINVVQVGTGTTTGFTVDVYQDYGNAKKKIAVEGLVTADFSLYNDTDAASITITSATESTTVPGRYVFVVPSQTATDNATLSLAATTATKPYDDGTWEDVVISFD